jgi:ABC-type glycerol-3-phosphate transport system substrate-binding protein
MKRWKKVTALFLTACLLLAIVGCSKSTGKSETGDSGETKESSSDQELLTDLGGFKFVLGDWWSAAVYEEEEPTTAWDQMVADYHHGLEDSMNFTYSQIGLQNMGTYNEVLVNGFLANDPDCTCFYGNPDNGAITSMAAQGLLYDLGSLDNLDLTDETLWNQQIINYYTINGKCYAARPSTTDEPRLGILFNKRLLEEAGIDPELPYTLQSSGEWDWSHFEQLCASLSRDTNNDGTNDVYAFGGNDGEMMMMGIYSDGAMFVERDASSGKFVDGTANPNFEEGLNWAVSLIKKGYVRTVASGDAWDKAYTDFANGQTAMLVSQTWVISSYLSEMADDFGYVMLPAGPNGHNCTNMFPTPICIPACLSKEDAEKTAAVISNWFEPSRKVEGADAMNVTFRDTYYSTFRDAQSVDDTVTAMVTDPDCAVYDSYYLIPNYDYGSYLWEVAAQTATPAEKIEALRPVNQAAIDAANALFGY